MKIKNIKVWSADLGNTKPYTIAFKTIDEVLNAFVEITLENGITGIGAANPSEYVTGENLDQTEAALKENNLEFLVGRDIREIHQLLFEIWQKFPKTPAARAALDIALHDAFTKFLGVPLVKYLGQKIKLMPTSNTIGIKNVEDTLKEAEEYGKLVKIKLISKLAIFVTAKTPFNAAFLPPPSNFFSALRALECNELDVKAAEARSQARLLGFSSAGKTDGNVAPWSPGRT